MTNLHISFFFKLLVLFAFNLALSVCVKGQQADTLFLSDEVLNIELRSDFTAIRGDTSSDPKPLNGKLTFYSSDGKTVKFTVKVRARGDFRRNPEICSFPPLQVNFKKKEVRNTIFNNQDKLKLVTACQREEDVIEEYLIYKMYNQVTDLSLKVRLVKVRYFDTSIGKEVLVSHSFFIEHEDQLGERTNVYERDSVLTPFDIERENFMKMSVFEYLIGNKDWFITSRRNVVIFRSRDTKALYAVPYDFDFAGLIDASYTKPRNVSDKYLSKRRVYKGLCYTEEEFGRTFEFYRKLRPVFESIINGQVLVSKITKRENIRYLEEFYNTIRDKELFQKEFLDVCETRRMYNLPEL
jgi:hypothetical protein